MKRTQAEEDSSSEMEVDEGETKNDGMDAVVANDDDEDSEDGGQEENVQMDDDDEDDEDGDEEEKARQWQERQAAVSEERSEFLDAFYGLTSDDPRERAVSGQVICHHSLLVGPSSGNLDDAAYALKRLLNGICSGRAAARQGNASALASFLKLAKRTGILAQIQQQQAQQDGALSPAAVLPLLQYVRQRLIAASSVSAEEAGGVGSQSGGGHAPGRKRDKEVKDNYFGRLFGILAIARSGILTDTREGSGDAEGEDDEDNNDDDDDGRGKQDSDQKDVTETCKGLLSDLYQLYNYKPFMREPTAHAICTLLNSFFWQSKQQQSVKGDNSGATVVLVQECIAKFLEEADLDQGAYSAEQVAISLNILAAAGSSSMVSLPSSVLQKIPIALTLDSIPVLASALADTCSVNPPRTHLVWDTLWLYLTEPKTKDKEDEEEKAANNVDHRVLRTTLGDSEDKSSGKKKKKKSKKSDTSSSPPSSSSSPQEIVQALVEHVLMEKLVVSASPDRWLLALTLVRILAGVEFVSSLSGRTQLHLEDVGNVGSLLWQQQDLMQHLFVDAVAFDTRFGGKKKQAAGPGGGEVTIGAWAVDSLNGIVAAATTAEAKLSLLKSMIRCNARFDLRTKSTAVQQLLGLNTVQNVDTNDDGNDGNDRDKEEARRRRDEQQAQLEMVWSSFVPFVQDRILLAKEEEEGMAEDATSQSNESIAPTDAVVLVDLLFRLCKFIRRSPQRVVDPRDADNENDGNKKSISESGHDRDSTLNQMNSFLLALAFVKPGARMEDDEDADNNDDDDKKKAKESSVAVGIAQRLKTDLPPEVQNAVTARLFSLLTDHVVHAYSSATHDPSKISSMREIEMLKPLLHVMEECKNLEQCGYAIMRAGKEAGDDSDEDEEDPIDTISGLLSNAKKTMSKLEGIPTPRDRFIVSMGLLGSFLYLCLLSGRDSDGQVGDPSSTMGDDNDLDEIKSLIEEAKLCSDAVLASSNDDDDSADNELHALIALCLNLVSWESDESRGAAKQMIREITKVILPSGLLHIAKSSKTAKLDAQAADMILQAVGVELEQDGDGDDNDDDDESESDSQSDGAANMSLLNAEGDDEDDEKMDDGSKQSNDESNEEDEEKEMRIDGDKLNELLEQSGDMDVDETELEHHEGADSALAAFLKRKQEARKAGRMAQERVDLSKQLRCVNVLETLVNGKPENWGPLLCCDILMSMIPSLLGRLSKLVKSISKAKASDTAASERSALLKKLTSFMNTKLFKSKMGIMKWTESVDQQDHFKHVVEEVTVLARRCFSEDHQLICYQSLPCLLRCLPSQDLRIQAASKLYFDAITEWSQKSRHVGSRMFDELITKDFVLAQSVLVKPLCQALPAAKTRFLKSECFRLISDLHNPKRNLGSNDWEKQALEDLVASHDSFAEGAASALHDKEMLKIQGVREMVKAIEKVVLFESPHLEKPKPLTLASLQLLEEGLNAATEKTESEKAKELCVSLLSKVADWKKVASENQDGSPDQSKKKKKKSKKKKR